MPYFNPQLCEGIDIPWLLHHLFSIRFHSEFKQGGLKAKSVSIQQGVNFHVLWLSFSFEVHSPQHIVMLLQSLHVQREEFVSIALKPKMWKNNRQ